MKRALKALALAAVAGALALVSAASASAAPSDPFVFKGSFNGSSTPAGAFSAGNVVVNQETGNVLVLDEEHGTIDQFDSAGQPVDFSALGSPSIQLEALGKLAIDNSGGSSQGNIYLAQDRGLVWGYAADGESLGPNYPLDPGSPGYSCGIGVDGSGHIWIPSFPFSEVPPAFAAELTPAGVATGNQAELAQMPALDNCSAAFDGLGHFYVNSSDGNVYRYDQGNGFMAEGEIGASNGNQIAIDPTTNNVYVDHGGSITATRFSNPLAKSAPFETLSGLNSGGLALDGSGQTMYVAEGGKVDIFHREPASAPSFVGADVPSGVTSSTALISGEFDTNGAPVTYHFEYGPDTNYGSRFPAVDKALTFSPFQTSFTEKIEGLKPGTTYHLRVVATNSAGTTYGPDLVFATYSIASGIDPCPNALARKQTGAQALLDCRAYELVSAADTGGYDVESSLVPGQIPFGGYPEASGNVLYATHSGAVPGPWNATNKGPDPYLATRGENGWSTNYVGLPANINPSAGGFSSVLGEADEGLNTLAFAGPGLCSPCFGSGLETGIPVRMPNGELVQGMSGSLAGAVPASAKPEGKVAKYFSADGKELLFASKYAFEPGANTNGDLTVYERNLAAGTTEIVSTDPSGNALTGTVSELGVSADGSRVITATNVSVDSQGNEYVHPYLHIAGDPHGIDLAPGTTSGVLFAGMSEDGSRAFFTTPDKLLPADTDQSPDLYEGEVDSSGDLSLKLITQGNSDACSPVANANGEHWNTTGASANCGAVAIAGGGGVASGTGAVYFLSPESFGGEGTLNQPNLYLAQPSGAVSFVATLEPNDPLVTDSVQAAATRRTGDFQATASGEYAAFISARQLTEADTGGNSEAFRYRAATGDVDCVSCDPTHTAQPSGTGDAALAPNGLSLADDGRVFFTTPLPLAISDTNDRLDVYEWEGGEVQLISSGISPFDSTLLSISADGTDAYFFTHDTLAPEEDRNGKLVKIYDARAGGGFFKLPQEVPCAAADECHGPGTAVPGAPDIKSSGQTSNGNVLTCPKNRVKKRGQCVKQKKAHAKKKHQKKRKSSAKKRSAKTNGKAGGRNA